MRPVPGRALTGATLVLVLALIAFGYSLVRAIHVDTGSPQPLPLSVPDDSTDAPATPLSGSALMLAVENDPFQPGRARPAERYRLPGDVQEAPEPPPPPAPPTPDFRLGGTVVFDEGGMALLGVGDGVQSFVSVGEAVNGYRLSSVTAREAVLENPFGSVVVEVAGPSQSVAIADGENEGRGRRGRGEQEERREAITQRLLRAAIQRAREDGATPQQLQMIEAIGERANDPQQMMQMIQGVLRNRAGQSATRRSIEIPPPPPPPTPGRPVPPAR